MTSDPAYEAESLHTPESRDRDARLVGHEPKGETMTDDPKCEAGCISYYGGEKKHHRDCPYYPESLTKLNADRIEALLAERDFQTERLRLTVERAEQAEAESEGALAIIATERAEVLKLREECDRLEVSNQQLKAVFAHLERYLGSLPDEPVSVDAVDHLCSILVGAVPSPTERAEVLRLREALGSIVKRREEMSFMDDTRKALADVYKAASAALKGESK